jgi:hypothetical protein
MFTYNNYIKYVMWRCNKIEALNTFITYLNCDLASSASVILTPEKPMAINTSDDLKHIFYIMPKLCYTVCQLVEF